MGIHTHEDLNGDASKGETSATYSPVGRQRMKMTGGLARESPPRPSRDTLHVPPPGGPAIYRSASLHSTLERTQQYTLFLQLIPTSRQCLSSSRGSSPLALSPIFSGLPPPKKIGVPVLFRSLLFLHRTVTNSKQPVVVNNTLQSAYSSPTKQTHSVFLYTANFLPTCITIPDYKPVEIYVHYIKI